MKILHESAVGKLCQMRWSDYRGHAGINPSSLADGLMGHSDVDVRAIHAAMTSTRKEPAQSSQDRMDRGSLLHLALLQPERLATDVAVWRGWEIDPETINAVKSLYVPRKVGQKKIAEKLCLDESTVSAVLSGSTSSTVRSGFRWEQFERENDGKLILRESDFEWSMSVYNELKNHQMCGGFLAGCSAEVAMLLTDCGEFCRGQVDAVDLQRRRIIDVKTTDAGVSQDSCERTIRTMHYREKMALYRRWIAAITGTPANSWRCFNLFISMDETTPAIAKIRMTDEALEWGEMVMVNALQKYAAARAANEFPIYTLDSFVDVKPWEVDPDPEAEVEIEF